MNTDNDAILAERFASITNKTDDGDWDDVVRRRTALGTRSRRRTRSVRLFALVAAIIVAVAVALVTPWAGSNASLNERALAAIGSQPVLHVVGDIPTQAQLLDIESGDREPIVQRQETWYDRVRGLKHTITTSRGSIIDDVLETPRGSYTPAGLVYDCTWIAAHPVEATEAGVSCNASGENGTKPRVVPRPEPTLVPGLAGFLDEYRQALSSGSARAIGKAQLDGETVDRLEFDIDHGTEQVALDPSTHKPVLIEDSSGWRMHIDIVETIPTSGADLSRPTEHELGAQPIYGGITEEQPLATEPNEIATVAPGATWPGPELLNLRLVAAYRNQLKTSFAGGTPATQTGVGLQLDYGTLTSSGRLSRQAPFVQIREAPSRALAFAYEWGFVRGAEPLLGQLYVPSPSRPLAFTRSNDRYLTIEASTAELLRAAARALGPVSG